MTINPYTWDDAYWVESRGRQDYYHSIKSATILHYTDADCRAHYANSWATLTDKMDSIKKLAQDGKVRFVGVRITVHETDLRVGPDMFEHTRLYQYALMIQDVAAA